MYEATYQLLAYDVPGHILDHGIIEGCCQPKQAAVKFLQSKLYLLEVPELKIGVSGKNGKNPMDSCWEFRLDELKPLL
jgi:hypothetical protein